MARKTHLTRKRMQVICSEQQEEKIKEAADGAGMGHDVSAWMLAHLMRATGASGEGTPLLIPTDLADKVRAAATAQGITPDKVIEQWLIVGAPS